MLEHRFDRLSHLFWNLLLYPLNITVPAICRSLLQSSTVNHMFDIDSWSLEPLPARHSIVDQSKQHGATVDQTGVVHGQAVEIGALDCREQKSWINEQQPSNGKSADGFGKATKIPWAWLELFSCEEELQAYELLADDPSDSWRELTDGRHERRILRNRAN